MITEAPLTKFSIIGCVQRWYQACPEAPRQPAGSCWHCGTGIAICVQIQHAETGEIHEIGTTCAERVGLSAVELKAMLANLYAAERAERSLLRSAQFRAEMEAQEATETALHGEHGTESRFLFGCLCGLCNAAAPHGTFHRFLSGECRCLDCIEAAVWSRRGEYTIRTMDVLVDVETGRIVDAKRVGTKFGMRWCVRDGADWLLVNPARRSTLAKRGYTEAECPFVVEVCGTRYSAHGQWYKPILPVGTPIIDAWGEPIPHEAVAA